MISNRRHGLLPDRRAEAGGLVSSENQGLPIIGRCTGFTTGRLFVCPWLRRRAGPVPLDGVVSGLWRDAVIETDAQGRQRLNRITYEISVLQALPTQLRCKEIWVVGANRYRNPDEDLPADFEAERAPYYAALKLPVEADRFIEAIKAEAPACSASQPSSRRH